MLGEERYSDSLAILELSVLLRLYPFQPPGQLAAWQRSMALAGVAHPRVRLQLARTLVLVARARAGGGAAGAALTGRVTHADVELLEGALLAAEAALALFQTEGACGVGQASSPTFCTSVYRGPNVALPGPPLVGRPSEAGTMTAWTRCSWVMAQVLGL